MSQSFAYLLLGSNLGDRAAILRTAVQQLGELAGTVVAVSALYETAPWGLAEQPAFLAARATASGGSCKRCKPRPYEQLPALAQEVADRTIAFF